MTREPAIDTAKIPPEAGEAIGRTIARGLAKLLADPADRQMLERRKEQLARDA